MTFPRQSSYLCLTLKSVLLSAAGARRVTVYHGSRQQQSRILLSDAAAERRKNGAQQPPEGGEGQGGGGGGGGCPAEMAVVDHVFVPPDSHVLDLYGAVLAGELEARRQRLRAEEDATDGGGGGDGAVLERPPPQREEEVDLIVMEDDVVLARRFEHYLRLFLGMVEAQLADEEGEGGPGSGGGGGRRGHEGEQQREFILSLYDGFCCGTPARLARLAAEHAARGDVLVPAARRGGWGWGSQALLFRGGALLQALSSHFNASRRGYEGLQDLFVADFARARGVPAFGVRPSLVQHVGSHSSLFGGGGSSGRFHAALAFLDDLQGVVAELGGGGEGDTQRSGGGAAAGVVAAEA